MRISCALSALFLQPLVAVPTTLLSPSILTGANSHPSPASLTFNLFGSEIPSSAVNAAFAGAITEIHPFLRHRPDDPITNDDFRYRAIGGSVQIGVAAVLPRGISWQQLDDVLRQVSSFMNGDMGSSVSHLQELSFEIAKDATKVGEGFVSYLPSHSFQSGHLLPVNPTDANDTNFQLARTDPSLNASTVNAIHFKVPDTPIKLIFGFFGDALPSHDVWAAFEGAHSQIVRPLAQHPGSPIPGERFEYRGSNIHITVLANKGTIMTWTQLSWILGGVYGFMTGRPERYQLLTCEISQLNRGNVGFASVWYDPLSLQVRKRALLNSTAPSLLSSDPESVPFPVPDTPIILTFRYFGLSIPWRELQDALLMALHEIRSSYRDHAADPVPENHFLRIFNGIRLTIIANVPHVMSWFQLHGIVLGLLLFVTGAEGAGEPHHQVLNFDVDDTRAGKLAYGILRYNGPRIAKS